MSEIRQVVRLMGTDLPGHKALKVALTRVKGIGKNLANMICHISGFDTSTKAGTLSDEDIKKIETEMKTIHTKLPKWMLNRQKDYDSGEDKHLFMTDIAYVTGNDKSRLSRIRSWRGLRLAAKLPVRGQKTRSNFRKKKNVVIKKKR